MLCTIMRLTIYVETSDFKNRFLEKPVFMHCEKSEEQKKLYKYNEFRLDILKVIAKSTNVR